jgi:hypothetical protein
MKCVKCQADNKLKERQENNGKCQSCQHPFTFDPKLGDGFTDPFFSKMLASLSVNDSLYFTPRQLAYFFNARQQRNRWLWPGLVALGGAGILLCMGLWPVSILLVIAAIVLWLPSVRNWFRLQFPRQFKAEPKDLEQWLRRWEQHNGKVNKFLAPPAQPSLPASISKEVTAYSFDRAVICDRDEVAHFLIANNFHFENNCAVLSINGYPQSIFTTVLEMLHRNPQLKVYALHDASPAGVQLVHRLRTTPRWFAERHGVTIYDLGLLPRQVMKRNMFVLQQLDAAQQAKRLPEAVRNTLQPDELKWLAEGKFVELESLAPMTLLKLLRDGIAKSRMPESDDALVVVGDSGYYGGGDGVSVYAVDSFG